MTWWHVPTRRISSALAPKAPSPSLHGASVSPCADPGRRRIETAGRICAHDCALCAVRTKTVCSVLDADDSAQFAQLARPVTFAPRQPIFQQDEPIDSTYTLTSGSVRLYRLLPDGRRQVVGFALPGDFLGLSMGAHSVYNADALTETTACKFNREALSHLVDQRPRLLRRLYELTNHELSLAQEQIVIIGRRTAEERVACFLIGLRDRWARAEGSSAIVPLTMTRQDIADFLGLTIETVSRIFSKLAREKVVRVEPGGVRLLQPERLEAIASS